MGRVVSSRPVMRLLDVLGRRWALRVIWELRDGPLTSRRLRAACDDVSPSALQARLDELRAAGLVTLEAGEGYRLSVLGEELLVAFAPLYRFADRWAASVAGD